MSNSIDTLIIGGGLAGTLLAQRLIDGGQNIRVVDAPQLSRCSRVAAGLINPIGGQRLKKVWLADTLIPFAIQRYRELEERLGQRLFHERPLIRLFANDEERILWKRRLGNPAYQTWISPIPAICSSLLPSESPEDGFLVKGSGYLDTNTLLDILAHQQRLAGWRIEARFDFSDLSLVDTGIRWKDKLALRVVFAEGHLATQNPFFSFVPYKPAKGVIGRVHTTAGHAAPDAAILKGKFLVPRHDGTLMVGATYDWDSIDDVPDRESIAALERFLQERLANRWQWAQIQAGVRPATAGAYPVVGPHPEHPQLWAFNGFGSKGSMQIPFFADQLAQALTDKTELPSEVLPRRFFKQRQAEPKRWKAVTLVRDRVLADLKPGDWAVDATAGNGHDTLWLAQSVTPNGHVFAIDLQEEAIASTRARLVEAHIEKAVTLVVGNHSQLASLISSERHGQVAAIVFNLGYLPGSDKRLITMPESTRQALEAAVQLLKPGGLLAVTLYPAHEGGGEESQAVQEWAQQLPSARFTVESTQHPAGLATAPFPIFIRKMEQGARVDPPLQR